MGWRRRLGVYQRKPAVTDASVTAFGKFGPGSEFDEIDEATATSVAAEMSACPIAPMLSPDQIGQRQLQQELAQWEREQRQQAREELDRQRRQAEAARITAQARADAQRAAWDRMEQYTRDRAAQADRDRLAQLERWATTREAADLQRQQFGNAAANRQRVVAAYQGVIDAMGRILQPADPEPMQPDQTSDQDPVFNPDMTLKRFNPW